jgi:hypothetical protein
MNALTATLPALRFGFERLATSCRGLLRLRQRSRPHRSEPSHSLLPLQTEWVDTAPGVQVTCLDGCLLLNYEGQQRDIILVRGESHSCDTEGRMVVHAFVATDLLIH